MKAINIVTGQDGFALRWNLHSMSELVVGYPEDGMDSDYSKNWVCACHGLPFSEGDYGNVLCSWELEK